jgi:iron-sulfur cluster assembly protein
LKKILGYIFMAITLTEAAAERVKAFLDNRGKGIGLRLGIKTSGCSGMAYVLEFIDEVAEDDKVFESQGVKIIVDAKSLLYIDGTELDYGKEGLNEGFQFNNPNVKDSCGCGESFTV